MSAWDNPDGWRGEGNESDPDMDHAVMTVEEEQDAGLLDYADALARVLAPAAPEVSTTTQESERPRQEEAIGLDSSVVPDVDGQEDGQSEYADALARVLDPNASDVSTTEQVKKTAREQGGTSGEAVEAALEVVGADGEGDDEANTVTLVMSENQDNRRGHAKARYTIYVKPPFATDLKVRVAVTSPEVEGMQADIYYEVHTILSETTSREVLIPLPVYGSFAVTKGCYIFALEPSPDYVLGEPSIGSIYHDTMNQTEHILPQIGCDD